MVRLSAIRYVFRARLGIRGALAQQGFAILGVAVGVALLFASQVSSTSLSHAVVPLSDQLVSGAQVQLDARSVNGVSDRLLTEVRQLPGVERASPVLERQISVIGSRGERPAYLIGVEPSAMKLSSKIFHPFPSRDLAHIEAIALPASLDRAIGRGPVEPIRVQVGARFTETFVGAALGEREIGALASSPIAVASIGYAQQLTRKPGTLTKIFIRYRHSDALSVRSELATLAGRWGVSLQPSTIESRLFRTATAPENTSEELFSVISALVGFLFVLVTVPSRRELVEDLSVHGYTPGMVVQLLMVDALVIGAVGCMLGLAVGYVLSLAVFDTTPLYLTFAFPVSSARVISWQAAALAITVGMLAAMVGVTWPLREAARVGRRGARRGVLRRGWRTIGVLTTIVIGLAIATYTLLYDTRASVLGNIALVVALTCTLPFAFKGAVAVFTRLSNVLDDVGSGLAVSELEASRSRVRHLAIAGTAALAVFGTVEFGGTQTNLRRGLDASIRGMDSSANIWVVPSGGTSLQATVPFASLEAGRLARIPGVRSISAYRGSFLDWGDHRIWVLAPGAAIEHPIPEGQMLQGSDEKATVLVRKGGWVVLSERLAREHHLRIGERFVLPTVRPTSLRLAGTTTDLGWPPGTVIMNAADYAAAWQSGMPSAYEIQTSRPAPIVRPLVKRALVGFGLSVQTAEEREALHYAAARQGLTRLTQIRLLILAAAILAVAAEMSAMLTSRRRGIAGLKAIGIPERALWQGLLWESTVILVPGCMLGALFGLYAQLLGNHFLSSVTGFPIVFTVEAVAAITSYGLMTMIVVAVLAIRGYQVVRTPISAVAELH